MNLGLVLRMTAVDVRQSRTSTAPNNLSVVSAFITQKHLRHEYARYYKYKIQGLADQSEWTGIRWIPCERNRADDLFRLR